MQTPVFVQAIIARTTHPQAGRAKIRGACQGQYRNRKVFRNNTVNVPDVARPPRTQQWRAVVCS